MPLTVIDILRQALVETDKSGYKAHDDRVLVMFDRARESLVPAKGRTPEEHCELTIACQTAEIELVKTIEPQSNPTEELAYVMLYKLGRNIPPERHRDLLLRTIARLEQP